MLQRCIQAGEALKPKDYMVAVKEVVEQYFHHVQEEITTSVQIRDNLYKHCWRQCSYLHGSSSRLNGARRPQNDTASAASTAATASSATAHGGH